MRVWHPGRRGKLLRQEMSRIHSTCNATMARQPGEPRRALALLLLPTVYYPLPSAQCPVPSAYCPATAPSPPSPAICQRR